VQAFASVSSGAPAVTTFNAGASPQLICIVVGWQSASPYVPPTVTLDNEIMILQSVHATDSAVGAVALYTLPVFNYPGGTKNLVITPAGFLGLTQIACTAYTGTSQQIAQIVTNEYGTSTAAVNTGTTTLPGVTIGSLSEMIGCTWFGGNATTINVTGAGWTLIQHTAATNQTINIAENAGSGNLPCTFTDAGANTWTMLVLGYEVLAGTPPGTAGVAITGSTAAVLGIINAGSPQTINLTPGATATLVVVAVAWASSSPLTPPAVTFQGAIMPLVATPMMVSGGNGAVALYALKLPTAVAGARPIVVNSNPNYAGYTCVAAWALRGTDGLLGQIMPVEIGAHDAPVFSGTATITGLSTNSEVMFVGATLFGNTPTSLFRSAGWADTGNANGTNQSVYSFNFRQLTGSSASITLNNPATSFDLICIAFEVLASGTPPPASTVQIVNEKMADLGTIGLDSATVTFDATGADLLIVAAARTNNSYFGPAAYDYGGTPLAMFDDLNVRNLDTSTAMEVAFLARPPPGVQTLTVRGHTGYWGYTTVFLVALKTLSGVVGMRVSQPISGTSANFALPDSVTGSLLLAFVSAIFPKQTVTPNYGWTQNDSNTLSPSINAWLFSRVGGPGQTLTLIASGYAAMAGIILELQVQHTAPPDIIASGVAAQLPNQSVGVAVNSGKLTPAGQDFHLYWETWEDIPNKSAAMLEPDDFYLSRIPSQVGTVILSFAIPRFTYTGLSSALKPTTGLNFPGSPALLKATLDLLRARSPGIKIMVALQQNTPEVAHNEPYDPTGWGGVTADNVASTLLFVQDMGLQGVVIDYECLSANINNDHRCLIDATTGAVTCYTDSEQLATIKIFRAGIPRPLLYLDGAHVGAYAQGAYVYAPPVGQNGGYNICVAHDSAALAALDGIHAMTYDAGNTYDPRIAFRAFRDLFPGMPIWLGLRVGPPQYEGVKQTADDIRDFCNTVIRLGGKGVHCYSGMWDVGYIGRYDGAQNLGPFGNYNAKFPDANIAAAVVADVFKLGTDPVPPGYGYTGRHNQLRVNNSHLLQGRMGRPIV
jgi:hypothetical protein